MVITLRLLFGCSSLTWIGLIGVIYTHDLGPNLPGVDELLGSFRSCVKKFSPVFGSIEDMRIYDDIYE